MSSIKVIRNCNLRKRSKLPLTLAGFLFVALLSLFSTESYAFAVRTYGGDLKITNWSTFIVTNMGQQKTNMEKWNFPAALSPSSTNTIRIEFGESGNSWRFGDKNNISGQVAYQVECGDNQIEQINILATTVEINIETKLFGLIDLGSTFNPYLTATTSGANCVSIMANGTKGNGDLGFVHDGTVDLTIVNTN
jgi:hypothetical protein